MPDRPLFDGSFRSEFEGGQEITNGLHKSPLSAATLPQDWQENFIAASFALQTWVAATSASPQNEQEITSTDGLHRWPGSSATAPQFLQVWAITSLLILA